MACLNAVVSEASDLTNLDHSWYCVMLIGWRLLRAFFGPEGDLFNLKLPMKCLGSSELFQEANNQQQQQQQVCSSNRTVILFK